ITKYFFSQGSRDGHGGHGRWTEKSKRGKMRAVELRKRSLTCEGRLAAGREEARRGGLCRTQWPTGGGKPSQSESDQIRLKKARCRRRRRPAALFILRLKRGDDGPVV